MKVNTQTELHRLATTHDEEPHLKNFLSNIALGLNEGASCTVEQLRRGEEAAKEIVNGSGPTKVNLCFMILYFNTCK